MEMFTNEIYSIIKPLQYIRINDFYASHLFYFRSQKTHTSPNSDAYLYIPKQMQAMQTTIAIHSSLHDIQYMFAMIEWLNLNIHTILSTILNPWIDCNVIADGAIWWIGATLETAMEKQWSPLLATLLSHAFQTFNIKWENGQVKYFGIKGFDM